MVFGNLLLVALKESEFIVCIVEAYSSLVIGFFAGVEWWVN